MNKFLILALVGMLAFASVATATETEQESTDSDAATLTALEGLLGSMDKESAAQTTDLESDEEEQEDDEESAVPAEEDVEMSAERRHTRESNKIVRVLNTIRAKLNREIRATRNYRTRTVRSWNRRVSRARRAYLKAKRAASKAQRNHLVKKGAWRALRNRRSRAIRNANNRQRKNLQVKHRELLMINKIECMVWRLNGHKRNLRNCNRRTSRLNKKVRSFNRSSKTMYMTARSRRVGSTWTIPAKSGARIKIMKVGMCGDSARGSGPNMFTVRGRGTNFRFGAGRSCSRRRNYRYYSRRNKYWIGCLARNRSVRFKYMNTREMSSRGASLRVRFDYHNDWDGLQCNSYDPVSKRRFRDPRSYIRYMVVYKYVYN